MILILKRRLIYSVNTLTLLKSKNSYFVNAYRRYITGCFQQPDLADIVRLFYSGNYAFY